MGLVGPKHTENICMFLGRNTTNSYSAGLLDGEGCVYHKNSPTVEITNKNKKPLLMLRKKWGGSVRVKSKKQAVYAWSVYGKSAIRFLKAVQKYTIIKREQIKTLLRIRKTFNKVLKKRLIKKLKELKNVYPT